MTKRFRPGAVGALLDEYEKVIIELKETIADISDEALVKIVDENAVDDNCKSLQSILSHVIHSGYAYAIYISNLNNGEISGPKKLDYPWVKDYQNELDKMFQFTQETFSNIKDFQLEESDNGKKIITSWGQLYDIEQIMEHAIVHILRHRRQIEKFKNILTLNN